MLKNNSALLLESSYVLFTHYGRIINVKVGVFRYKIDESRR